MLCFIQLRIYWVSINSNADHKVTISFREMQGFLGKVLEKSYSARDEGDCKSPRGGGRTSLNCGLQIRRSAWRNIRRSRRSAWRNIRRSRGDILCFCPYRAKRMPFYNPGCYPGLGASALSGRIGNFNRTSWKVSCCTAERVLAYMLQVFTNARKI